MREIIEKRRTHCKVFDLGGRKRKVRVSRAPLHYVRDGKLVDIDTTPRLAGKLLEVTEAPYRLKIDPDRPAYLYTNENGRQVEVELIEVGGKPVNARGSAQEAGAVRWRGVAPQTDAAFRPLRKGVEALVVLYGPEAPRTWKWRVRGDKELLLPPKGRDAKGQTLELAHRYDGDILTIEWTGRATSRRKLRRTLGWSQDVAYPVVIDPTVNETIVAGADDAGSDDYFNDIVADRTFIYAGAFAYIYIFGGFRFQTVAIPQGATITSATLTIDIMQTFKPTTIEVYADDVDDAPVWSLGSRIRDITKTTAFKSISPTATGFYPIDVVGIVQEIVDRPGWASGNNIRFGMFPTPPPDGDDYTIEIAAFEHATRTEAQLEIEYEEAAAARVAPKMMHYMRFHNG